MMKSSLLLVVLIGFAAAHFEGHPHRRRKVPAVPTTSGVLNGIRSSVDLGSVKEYLGVPYAQAPVGELRFLPPRELPADATDEERDASKFAPACVQPKHVKDFMSPLLNTDSEGNTSEDCLTLNVYVPEVDDEDDEALPVIVWLPGEGFDYADPKQFDGRFLALQVKAIVVTVNYRVSVFGFLSTLTPEAPGNVGLYDQRMALRWVKKNAAKFGGDAKRVTVMGRFTGAMAISVHLTTPLKEKLFEKAVLQSGVAVGPYVFDMDPMNATKTVAEKCGCPTDFIPEMIGCLQEVPASELLKNSFFVSHRFRLVFDGELVVDEPIEAAKRGHIHDVDIILGSNSNEGSICLLSLFFLQSHYYDRLIENQLTSDDFAHMVNENLKDFTKKDDQLLTKIVTHQYKFLHKRESLRVKYIDFCGSMYITTPIEKFAQLASSSEKGKVFVYEFTHRPSFSQKPGFISAAHGDDVLFSLGLVHKSSSKATPDELTLSNQMTTALSNFARDSAPFSADEDSELEWPQFTTIKQQVLHFNTGRPTIHRSTHEGDVAFWYEVAPAILSRHSEHHHHHHSHQQLEELFETTLAPRVSAMTSSRMTAEAGHQILSSSSGAKKGSSVFLSSSVFSAHSAFCIIVALAACNLIFLIAGVVVLTRYCRRSSQQAYAPLEKI